jgi:hypothetical protein
MSRRSGYRFADKDMRQRMSGEGTMARLLRLAACAPAVLLALAACKEDTGYVEIKVAPGFIVPPLVLRAARVDTTKAGSTVLREKVGAAKLEYERDGRRVPFCDFEVRKNRIVTVAVSAFGRDPRCKVEG